MGDIRRKVLFTDCEDFMLIITDAPKEAIEKWCSRYYDALRDGTYGRGKEVQLFDTLKASYSVKELLDSVLDDTREDIEIIGYDESYDYNDYSPLKRTKNGFRTVKLTAGMTQEFEIISTNAPDSVIKAQLAYTSACSETGEKIENPYAIIEAMGYVVNVLGSHEDFDSCELRNAIIDAEFDFYDF